jgi:hypothetical protein
MLAVLTGENMPISYGYRWHENAANNVLMALFWEREAIMCDHPGWAGLYRSNARDRLVLAEGSSVMAAEDEAKHGTVFPGEL